MEVKGQSRKVNTYIFPYNRAKTRAPQNPLPTDLIHEQPLSTKHRLPQSLTFVLRHNALRAR